jgi:flagellar hook assembly protein FlgD
MSNAQGNEVRSINSTANATDLHYVFDGRDEAGNLLAPGLYLVKIIAGDQVESSKILLVR